MDYHVITKDNIKLYAAKHYNNVYCSGFEEFEEDFKIPKYIKKLFNKYEVEGELKERLVLNHLTLFYNIFDQEAATKILFFRIDEEHYPILKTFLVFLQRCPDVVDFGDRVIYTSNIPLNQYTVDILRKI